MAEKEITVNYIFGNHDKKKVIDTIKARAASYGTMMEISINGHFIVLNHYAMRVWNKSHFNTWHLYGHSHGMLPVWGKSLDVGVDEMDFCPVSINSICSIMNTL